MKKSRNGLWGPGIQLAPYSECSFWLVMALILIGFCSSILVEKYIECDLMVADIPVFINS